MSKFGKFLEDEPQSPRKRPASLTARSSTLLPKENVSIKINANTLKQLKLLKTIEGFRSYSDLMDTLLETYIHQAEPDLAHKIRLLQD